MTRGKKCDRKKLNTIIRFLKLIDLNYLRTRSEFIGARETQ